MYLEKINDNPTDQQRQEESKPYLSFSLVLLQATEELICLLLAGDAVHAARSCQLLGYSCFFSVHTALYHTMLLRRKVAKYMAPLNRSSSFLTFAEQDCCHAGEAAVLLLEET
jgi:hypothetical protein